MRNRGKRQGARAVFIIAILTLSALSFRPARLYADPPRSGGPSAFSAQVVSSKDLIKNAKSLDGKKVLYKAEAVTAILNRGEYSWVNLNDGSNAIGVWCPSPMLGTVKYVGDYKFRGDLLEVEGVFHRACPVHGGELDIHAQNIAVVERGFPVKDKPDEVKFSHSMLLFGVIILALILFRKRI